MKKILLCLLFSSVALARIAPSFRAETMDGRSISLRNELKADRVLLLSFWASWCTNCLDELKVVTTNLKTDNHLPLDLLTINVDDGETASEVKPTLRCNDFKFPVVLDPKREIFGKFRSDFSLPFSVLIGPSGEILETFNGYSEDMFSKVKAAIAEFKKSGAHVK